MGEDQECVLEPPLVRRRDLLEGDPPGQQDGDCQNDNRASEPRLVTQPAHEDQHEQSDPASDRGQRIRRET
jgi:hypothetical protein